MPGILALEILKCCYFVPLEKQTWYQPCAKKIVLTSHPYICESTRAPKKFVHDSYKGHVHVRKKFVLASYTQRRPHTTKGTCTCPKKNGLASYTPRRPHAIKRTCTCTKKFVLPSYTPRRPHVHQKNVRAHRKIVNAIYTHLILCPEFWRSKF